MTDILNSVGAVVWGAPMLTLFMATSLRFTVKSRFYQITHLPHILKQTIIASFRKPVEDGISQRGVFFSVLGACIGTGNIIGVATAIFSGGPGAVFWMWISAIFSMMCAYTENYLGISFTKPEDNIAVGSLAYIEKGIKMKGLAKVYALLCLASSMGMGNLTQSNSLADSLHGCFNLNKLYIGIIVSVVCFIILVGGIKRIVDFGTLSVPFMSLFYLVLSSAVLIKFRSNILPALRLILTEAFSVKAFSGYGMYKAVRYGISRGVFSNEAGLGTSTLLHSQARSNSPEKAGMWAISEVFTDTVFLCTVTALVILVSTDSYSTMYGSELSVYAYGTIGSIGKAGISLLTSVFAFTSLIGCSFYGEKSFQYLFGSKHLTMYKIGYAILAAVGCVASPRLIWSIADICNGLMAVPNLFALNCLSEHVKYPDRKSK